MAVAIVTPKLTPPTVFGKLSLDTPFKSTSSSQRANEQTHEDIDERIFQEINGCVFQDTGGFNAKYFEGKQWSAEAQRIAERVNPQVVVGRWRDYPQPQRRSAYHTSPELPLAGSECKCKPDLFVTSVDACSHQGKYKWTDVQVIGELKQSEIRGKYTKELLSFCGHAREVFASQPTRRFLHGFFIRGSFMELWVFDRSGPYNCGRLDIHQDPSRFIRILGVNTYIKEDKICRYIMFKGEKTEEEQFYLEDTPIALQQAIVCRGTTSKLFGYHDLETIADLREGLQFGRPKAFRSARKDSINQSRSKTQGSMLADALGISLATFSSSSSRQKRKRSDETFPTGRLKRSRSGSRRQSDSGSPIKVQVNSSAIDGSVNVSEQGVEQSDTISLTAAEVQDDSFENRIFSCLVIWPPRRAIHEFTSGTEFLEACRDFLKGHRSLYVDGRMLHRDISDNTIITNPEREGDPRGMLIDLDLAKDLDGGPSGARHRTGTMEFMAIEVLEGRPHTCRHDLGSLFYVFLWVTIGHSHDLGQNQNLPREIQLRDWYRGSYAQIANTKRGHMDKKTSRGIVTEIPSRFEGLKRLAGELRDILFPIREESLFTGTYHDSDELYQPMIEAFEREIANLQK
ncbi:hypothetical protein BDY21DRAFT_417793 [Lineolata rhizophorae]|uniref:Fungal-type protein kinase domain-containing protein n=1 Tax=Lineolata rhizophorae TaxID=578093 RepID=A0A6A6NL03_9PEZI|nr:hypothetical protein BDY21DRAFT_417793 [Lineolata rhizophorae]